MKKLHFKIKEAVSDSLEKVSVARSIADVLKEALESVQEEGGAFTGNTVLNVIEAIHRYSKEAEYEIENIYLMMNEIHKKEV